MILRRAPIFDGSLLLDAFASLFPSLFFSRNRWNSSPLPGTASPRRQTDYPESKEKTRRRPRGEAGRGEEEEEEAGASSFSSL